MRPTELSRWGRESSYSRRDVLRGLSAASAALFAPGTAAQENESYDLEDARRTGYWYFRFNGESVLLSEAGVQYPDRRYGLDDGQFSAAIGAIRDETDTDDLPVRGLTSLTIAPYAAADPRYGTRPTFVPRPVQGTLLWDGDNQRQLTPAGVAYFVQTVLLLAQAFEELGDPETGDDDVANGFAALYELAGWRGIEYAFGEDGALRDFEAEDEGEDIGSLSLVRSYEPGSGEIESTDARPLDYAAVLWCLSVAAVREDIRSTVESAAIEMTIDTAATLADATARTVVERFDARTIESWGSIADVGIILSALATYGSVRTDATALADVEEFGAELAEYAVDRVEDSGRIDTDDDANQAAVQGAVGQGLTWAGDGLGVTGDAADEILSYLLEDTWRDEIGTFDDDRTDDVITYSIRETGDVVGGLVTALHRLDEDEVRDVIPAFVDRTINRARVQRAQRPPAVSPDATHWLPYPENAAGWFGQAPVLTGAVTYDRDADIWSVTDRAFRPGQALYTACQFGRLAMESR